ncbi:MAG: DUF2877 domain-containing protein, partial [Methanobacteriota archaeon]
VARSDISLSPIDLITDISPTDTRQKLGVKKGMKVLMAGNSIFVGEVLEISLDGVKLWHPPTRVEKPLRLEQIKRNLEVVKRSALSRGRDEGLGQLLFHLDSINRLEMPPVIELNGVARAALPHLINLMRATRLEDIEGVETAAKNLVGLGLGLSPSADDMLVGFTSALWWISNSFGKGVDRIYKINKAISSYADITNLLSGQLLAHAARGEVNERLAELLAAILARLESDIDNLVDLVTKIGETSGLDVMVGLILGAYIGMERNFMS